MSSHPRRFRSSTSASNQPTSKAFDVLRGLIERLANDASSTGPDGYPDFGKLVHNLRFIAQHVAASTSSVLQDDFRHARGFETVLDVLRRFSGYYDPRKRSEAAMLSLFGLLGDCLTVLSAALKNHSGNRRFFRYRVEGGGWEALEQIIASIGLGGAELDPWAGCHLFGKLLAFSLDEDGLDLLCQAVAKALRSDATGATSQPDDNRSIEEDDEQWDLVLARSVESIAPAVREVVNARTMVRFPEILRAVVSFWRAIPRSHNSPASPSSVLVLETILCAISASFYNRAAVHSTGILSQFLQVAFGQDSWVAPAERDKLLAVCKLLMLLGVNQPADTQFLLLAPGQEASDFCLDMMSEHSGPPFFQFDLSLHGHASIELPSLGRVFPPQSNAGYTFTAWIRVESFDPASHTTIFGVFDASQTCFVLMYLEKDTHNLILQTSVFSNKPSVRFKSVEFREKKWYHVAVVHKRPRTMTASKASLYVNGEFAEQMRCNYPQVPPLLNGSNETFVSFNPSQNRTNPVQAFIGTPRELAGRTGPGVISSQWSLASAHLFEDCLSDDYLAVHHGLGPRYQGNFQDSLGGFQTYEASAALGLRNEIVHPGKDEASDILRAVRDKASSLLPESKILLSVLPTATFPEHVQYLDTGVLRSLPRTSIRSLFHMSNQEGSPLAVNCAVSSLSDAFFRAHGMASLRGNPIIAVPSHLDENLWRLAGFTPLALKLLERASTVEDTVRAIEIVFHCIRKSWRNSEAMERDNGYGILGMILRFKMGYGSTTGADVSVTRLSISNEDRDRLTFQILSLILGFVGYNHVDPIESFIVNPLAYRILLIDLDIWRRSATITQELFYKQFVTFAVNSKHHDFNSRRLIRMRIVKRLLDSMKGEGVSEDVSEHFMGAFGALVKSNLSQEVMRSMSLFITYAFHTPLTMPRTPKYAFAISRSSTPGPLKRASGEVSRTQTPPVGSKMLPKKQLGKRVLSLYSEILCEKGNVNNIKKFARTVTNKWLLYLLADEDATVVLLGCKILARVLVAHGSSYTSKFSGKSGGFIIMANRLKRFWDVPTLWAICFSILFGYDVAEVDFDRDFNVDSLLRMCIHRKVAYPESLVVITSLLQHGLKEVMRHQDDPESPVKISAFKGTVGPEKPEGVSQAISMHLVRALESRLTFSKDQDRVAGRIGVLEVVCRFLHELQGQSSEFRDFALGSEWVRMLLLALYPVIVSADAVTPDVELHCRDSALTFEGSDVIIRPLGGGPAAAPIVRTTSIEVTPSPQATPPKGTPLRRASSFVLLTAQTESRPAQPKLPSPQKTQLNQGGALAEGIIDLLVDVFMDQVFTRKEFSGFGLFSKVPPGFQEHQAYLESYVLKKVTVKVSERIRANDKAVCEPRILTNLSRLCLHVSEAIFEGWFINGAEFMIDLSGTLIEMLQRPEISKLKSVRLCSGAVAMIRGCFLRIILLRLSDLDNPRTTETEAKDFMNKLAYWQMPILECLSLEDDYLKLFWYQLYTKLIDDKPSIRIAAANFLRIVLVQKPEESVTTIRSSMVADQQKLSSEFQKLTEVDDETFVVWVDQHRPSLDGLFLGTMAKAWEDFVGMENQRTSETAKTRLSKRRDRLKAWHAETLHAEKILLSHEVGNSAWMKSIYNTEHFKYQRILQDQQDDLIFLTAAYSKMERDLRRPGAVFSEPVPPRWKLDRTEGRNRMRLRLLPDATAADVKYQPKRKEGEPRSRAATISAAPSTPVETAPSLTSSNGNEDTASLGLEPQTSSDQPESVYTPEDDFELVDDPNDPNDGDENFEDKNRKVMRRLEHGEQVQAAYNMSRITGLEACEGLLIVGKDALYIMDNVFQCANGDIVNVWEAPSEERDPFTMVVTGTKTLEGRQNSTAREQESRHWKWHDVISVSKRRFLFRDVAIEIFFTDGRSYLLTTINPAVRDELFSKMLSKASHTSAPNALPYPEDAWRLEALKTFDDPPQGLGAGLGSRLGTLFNAGPWNPAMKRWQRGEMSNFHYLMMVNTMAGRTFNDLTQYPVFPWVLADYTSEDLDLEDPATFRDLSKPMGAQTVERVSGFVETYNALREIGQTPFHYGTHYSSAMIVSSYLIRLPPFVQSYLLVQGDKFDYADRLFQSVGDAWNSASCKNKTDVRELIPEFFCLPEFLTNINGYDFGHRQSNGVKVDHVALPPWAKGDPKIFIAKHREALESHYVSENLHHWIDLIFGYKQLGEAAVENLNVFHHLSYAGASDLDRITDANERAITAGVIHNFGQTPHQVFSKSHPPREHVQCPTKRLDTGVFLLTCLDHPLLESHNRVASLMYPPKLDRLLCASPLRVHFPPYDKFLEWGYADSSIRFFFSDNRKPAGLFENLHTGQISCACFADSKTLITAGEDCVVSVYTVHTAPGKQVDLMPRSSVFGHKTPVTAIAVSKAFSTFVTASSDGQAFLWDLNRLSFIRKLPLVRQVECARINDVTGEILLCSGPNVLLYTINGSLILDQNVCSDRDDYVHSCAFYEGAGNEWLENHLIFTGHSRGRVNIWRKSVQGGKWTLELLRRLDHAGGKVDKRDNTEAGITCIAPMPTCLYTGDDDGRVYEWNFGRGDR
ncbi:hypothetical protein HIM_04648 [Hirsutella minnesotensis 3608]|uniref:Beige protein homolog 1 n=1 Tax=Hirsutella minnesotensis 3608 TaxID=1043627 RepID=A0A0F8A5S2_9HYPO|nr:hypothetical protein HIM_04648 [Hirsutella minnesotensis 3608]